jgi:hypothetical protein
MESCQDPLLPLKREAGRDFKEGRLKPPNCSYKAVLQKGEIE